MLDAQAAQRVLPRAAAEPGSWLDHFHPSLNLPNVVLGAVVVLCVALLAYALMGLRRGRPAWAAPGASAAADGVPAAHLAEARAHAEAGRLAEALHALLLQALADVRAYGGARLDASLTSREVLRHARLPDAGAAALGGIITEVEWTYFGLRPATQAAWQASLARLDQLGAALGQRP